MGMRSFRGQSTPHNGGVMALHPYSQLERTLVRHVNSNVRITSGTLWNPSPGWIVLCGGGGVTGRALPSKVTPVYLNGQALWFQELGCKQVLQLLIQGIWFRRQPPLGSIHQWEALVCRTINTSQWRHHGSSPPRVPQPLREYLLADIWIVISGMTNFTFSGLSAKMRSSGWKWTGNGAYYLPRQPLFLLMAWPYDLECSGGKWAH